MFTWVFFVLLRVSLAVENMHLLVLDFSSVGEMDPNLLLQLSDETRGAALEVFPNQTSKINVLTRESLMDFVQQQGKDASCLEGECAVDIARNIEAQFVIVGTVYDQSDTMRVNIKAFDAQTNQLLGDITVSRKNVTQLLTAVHDDAFNLIEDKIGPYDEGRKGIQTIRPPRYTVAESPYTLLQLKDTHLMGASIEVNGKTVCQGSSSTVCTALVNRGEEVDVSILKEGYDPIVNTIQVADTAEIQTMLLKFVPQYGILKVSVLDPFGKPCNGDVFIDDEKMGDSPWSGKVLAVEHDVMVDCDGMRKVGSVTIIENASIESQLQVLPFSVEDLGQAQQQLKRHRMLDWTFVAMSGASAAIATSSFMSGQTAFQQAAAIETANNAEEYQDYLNEGSAQIQKSNLNLIVFGVSTGVGVVHNLWFTGRSRRHLREIEEIRRASDV